MSGETKKNRSGWTVDTLFQYMEKQFELRDTAVQAALLNAEKATTKAEVSSEKRLEGMNEFRGQLSDQANTFLPRTEAEARLNALADKLSAHEQQSQERVDTDRKRIVELELRTNSRLDLTQGKSVGVNASIVYLFAGIAAISAIVSIVLAVFV